MAEEKEGFFSSLGLIRKFHPVAFLLIFSLMWLFTKIVNSNSPMTEKIVPSALLFSLYLIGLLFEFQRISKEQETTEKVFLVNEEKWGLQILGVINQRASHIRPVEGIVKVNPHLRVICPKLASGEDCQRGKKNRG